MSVQTLGIDIGGTKIAAASVDSTGNVAHYHTAPTPAQEGAEAILNSALGLARKVLAAAPNVVAIGVGTAGQVDHDRGVISYASELLRGWTGAPVAQELHHALGIPVSVENDVNAMALGEMQFGAGRDFGHALYVTVGTGIGGAIVHEGQLWRGASWTAGEIAHVVIDWQGARRCACGATGHLEPYTSGPYLAQHYSELAGLDEILDLRAVAARAHNGDPLAQRAIAEGARILGLGLGGLLNVLDPEALIVGGGVPELGELWWEPFEAALRANPMPGPSRIALRRAQFSTHAVLIGAAWLALYEHAPSLVESPS